MSDLNTTFTIMGRDGKPLNIDFHAKMYEEASNLGISLTQYLNRKFGAQVDESKDGSVIGQMMADAGMFLGQDQKTGFRSPTMKDVVTDGVQMSAITRNEGDQRHTPSGRLLFPEVIMRTMEDRLRRSDDLLVQTWEKMVATTATVNSARFDQPLINVTEPEQAAANPVSQLAEPDAMISITTSEYSKNIPTKSIGLVIADQAMEATTLDLVNLAMSAQARGEQVRMIEGHMRTILNGDEDMKESAAALNTTSKAVDHDSDIAAAGELSHKAWVKWLWSRHQYRTLNYVCCDIDTSFAIDNRAGKPTFNTNYNTTGENLYPVNVSNPMINIPAPTILPLSSDIIGADTIMGLDSRYAIRRVINVNAAYSAMEQWLLRRATAFRMDFGEMAHKLYDDAFDKMTLTL